MNKFLFSCCVFILLVAPKLVVGECTSLKYKLAAIASILIAGAIGVCLPIAGRAIPSLRPEKDIFFIIKAFAAGVILSTGFIRVLPDAFENLTSPCLNENPRGNFPFTGFVAMMAAIGTLMVDAFATSYYQKSNLRMAEANKGDEEKSVDENGGRVHVHTHATHGHAHGSVSLDQADTQLLRHRVISQVNIRWVLDFMCYIFMYIYLIKLMKQMYIFLHYIFSHFHHFTHFFHYIFRHFHYFTPTALIVEGVFNAASAGILIYMSLVDLLAASNWSNISLLLGAGCMSLLAKWA
ncbi:hypothetical protein ACOSQ2_028788 [Xanthoceras sorbifolium]